MSPDGKRIVTGASDGTIKLWEADSGWEPRPFKAQSLEIGCVAYSPDGRWVLTGSWDKSAKLWDTTSSREAFTLEEPASQCMCGTFSLDGRRIVIGCYDGTAKVWDAASGRKLVTLQGHSGVIGSVAFSPDGQRILTGSWDKTARLWEAASGRELLTFRGHSDRVVAVSFSADGQRILTGSIDKTVRVWDAARPEQVTVWQEQETAAAQALAAGERKRKAEQEVQAIVRARESIKQWLILAPIALAPGQSGAEGLDCDQIQGEGRVRPKAGEVISVAGGELRWREVALTNEVIDFNALLGRDTDRSVAYAVCYLRSDTDQSGLQMLVGSDDESKVYLNGKQIYKCLDGRPLVPDEDTVPDITLNAGLNVLVFKVVNETIQWQGSVRFTDAAGQFRGLNLFLHKNVLNSVLITCINCFMAHIAMLALGGFIGTIITVALMKTQNWSDSAKVVTALISSALSGVVFTFIEKVLGTSLGEAIFWYPVGLLIGLMCVYMEYAMGNIKSGKPILVTLGVAHIVGVVVIIGFVIALLLSPALRSLLPGKQ
jgi:WD40 repeat protein